MNDQNTQTFDNRQTDRQSHHRLIAFVFNNVRDVFFLMLVKIIWMKIMFEFIYIYFNNQVKPPIDIKY